MKGGQSCFRAGILVQNPGARGVFFSISISPDFRADGDSWRLAASGLHPPPALDLKSGLMDLKSGLMDTMIFLFYSISFLEAFTVPFGPPCQKNDCLLFF